MHSLEAGTLAGTGSFRCADCDYTVGLAAVDELPPCPSCGGTRFVRASLFTRGRMPAARPEEDDRLRSVRDSIDEPGRYLAWEQDGELSVFAIEAEWTRIGRSLAADVRFDDPTVSRRHALIVRAPDGVRVLDDRSLNGVWVNGERVEWRALADGDEIMVGRHRLRFLDVPAVSGMREGVTEETLLPS